MNTNHGLRQSHRWLFPNATEWHRERPGEGEPQFSKRRAR